MALVDELVAAIKQRSDVTVSPEGMQALEALAELARKAKEPELETEDGQEAARYRRQPSRRWLIMGN